MADPETPQTAATEHPEGYLCYTKIYYCHHCVGQTLHYRDDSDGMWTCPSCGSGRRERDWSRGDALGER